MGGLSLIPKPERAEDWLGSHNLTTSVVRLALLIGYTLQSSILSIFRNVPGTTLELISS